MSEYKIIPFLPEFEERLVNGQKTATTRMKKYGNVGDLFSALNHTFQITKVEKVYLGDVASQSFDKEGFASQSDFMECWRRLHPKRNRYDTIVYYHEFKRLVWRTI